MSSLQQFLLENGGGSSEKIAESGLGKIGLQHKIGDKLLPVVVEPVPVGPSSENASVKLKKLLKEAEGRGGRGIYPMYSGFSKEVIKEIGEEIKVDDREVPFLPLYSVIGIVSSVNPIGGGRWLKFDLDLGGDVGTTVAMMAVGIETEQNASSVSFWLGSAGEKDKFRTSKSRMIPGSGEKFVVNSNGKMVPSPIDLDEAKKMVGKTAVFGMSPGYDYLICDTDLESGGYSHEVAWYAPDGTPAVDAVIVTA